MFLVSFAMPYMILNLNFIFCAVGLLYIYFTNLFQFSDLSFCIVYKLC